MYRISKKWACLVEHRRQIIWLLRDKHGEHSRQNATYITGSRGCQIRESWEMSRTRFFEAAFRVSHWLCSWLFSRVHFYR